MQTAINNILVTDMHTGQQTCTAASGWIVSATFNHGVASSPFTVFLQSPVTVSAWDAAALHRITADELTAPLNGIGHHDDIPTTPPLIACW